MLLSIASGKGGTGKTLIATNLARFWADEGHQVTYVDADAEEPNGHLFLRPKIQDERDFSVLVPTLDGKSCAGHGRCQEICSFNAILSIKGSVMVFDELCHGCGACVHACPDSALTERTRPMGIISYGEADRIEFYSGTLNVGEARVTPLIDGVIDKALPVTSVRPRLVVIDSPPGTSCAAMAAAERADLLLLVTEPTPFGLHDLALAIEMGRALGRPLAAVINRSNLGDLNTQRFLEKEKVPILAEIPFDRGLAQSYANARLPLYECESFREKIESLSEQVLQIAKRGTS